MSLLALTLAGSVATTAVLLLDRAFSATVEARSRQWWWFAIPLAFILLPIELPLLSPPSQSLPPPDEPVFSLAEALGLPATPLSRSPGSFSLPLALWGAGVATSLLYFGIATFRTSRRWQRERLSTNARLLALLEDCRAVAGISAPIGLIVSSRVPSPALLGWLRPRLLLPKALAEGASDEQLRAILLHELAHFKTTDIAARWPFLLASALHWFNPVAHLASWRWMQIQEEAADERALQWLRKSALPGDEQPERLYLEALLTAGRASFASPAPRQFGALALVETSIKKRVMKIQHSSRRTPRRLLTVAVALLLFGGATFRPTQAGQTASAAESDPAKEEASAAMEKWLALIDSGKYAESWDASSAFFKANVARDFWVSSLQSVRAPLGKLKMRKLSSALHQQSVPLPDGTMKKVDAVIAQFDTSFDNLHAARETVTFEREKDGSWRASGYYIKPM